MTALLRNDNAALPIAAIKQGSWIVNPVPGGFQAAQLAGKGMLLREIERKRLAGSTCDLPH